MAALTLTEAHLLTQRRLRETLAGIIAGAWDRMPSYDEADVKAWLRVVVPVVEAAQRQSVALTDAYLARELGRQPVGVTPESLVGGAVRGVDSQEEWRRPFVTAWTALKDGVRYEDAVRQGLARAQSLAVTDVQLSSWAAYQAVQDSDPQIRGYRRVANAAACGFCRQVNGAVIRSATAAPLHPGCGCGLAPLTEPTEPSPLPDSVAVHDHGELGPVLHDPAHHFDTL